MAAPAAGAAKADADLFFVDGDELPAEGDVDGGAEGSIATLAAALDAIAERADAATFGQDPVTPLPPAKALAALEARIE